MQVVSRHMQSLRRRPIPAPPPTHTHRHLAVTPTTTTDSTQTVQQPLPPCPQAPTPPPLPPTPLPAPSFSPPHSSLLFPPCALLSCLPVFLASIVVPPLFTPLNPPPSLTQPHLSLPHQGTTGQKLCFKYAQTAYSFYAEVTGPVTPQELQLWHCWWQSECTAWHSTAQQSTTQHGTACSTGQLVVCCRLDPKGEGRGGQGGGNHTVVHLWGQIRQQPSSQHGVVSDSCMAQSLVPANRA